MAGEPPPPLPPPALPAPATTPTASLPPLPVEFLGLGSLVQSLRSGPLDAADGAAPASGADDDTIAAIVTGAQQGAVSIIRLSGLDAVPVAQRVFRPAVAAAAAAGGWEPESHRIYYGSAVDAAGAVLDEVLLLAMLEPRSYTAEDVIEIHTHGGGISAQRVLQVRGGGRRYAAALLGLLEPVAGRLHWAGP